MEGKGEKNDDYYKLMRRRKLQKKDPENLFCLSNCH